MGFFHVDQPMSILSLVGGATASPSVGAALLTAAASTRPMSSPFRVNAAISPSSMPSSAMALAESRSTCGTGSWGWLGHHLWDRLEAMFKAN